jgi:hypothetical protein
MIKALAETFFGPHQTAAGSAAEAVLAVIFELGELGFPEMSQDFSGLPYDPVVAPEITGVMISQVSRETGPKLEPTVRDKIIDQDDMGHDVDAR